MNIYPVCSWIAKTFYPAHPYKELQVNNVRENSSFIVGNR
jgi:hypothetical protein